MRTSELEWDCDSHDMLASLGMTAGDPCNECDKIQIT